jgi:hypothetical protein
LEFVDQIDERAALLRRHPLRGIEPDEADRAVLRQEFAHLRLDVPLDVAVEVLFRLHRVPIVAVPAGMMPILRL